MLEVALGRDADSGGRERLQTARERSPGKPAHHPRQVGKPGGRETPRRTQSPPRPADSSPDPSALRSPARTSVRTSSPLKRKMEMPRPTQPLRDRFLRVARPMRQLRLTLPDRIGRHSRRRRHRPHSTPSVGVRFRADLLPPHPLIHHVVQRRILQLNLLYPFIILHSSHSTNSRLQVNLLWSGS